MAILDPIAPYLAMIDRLISLIQAGKTRRKDYFEKIIDPLYVQFVPLGEDLLGLFRSARETVTIFDKKHKSTFEKDGIFAPAWSGKLMTALMRDTEADLKAIQSQRNKFADARSRLRGLLTACEANLTKKGDEELVAFVSSMERFFNPKGDRMVSAGQELVNLFVERLNRFHGGYESVDEHGTSFQLRDNVLAEVIVSATLDLERSWFEIAGRYMEQKLKNTVD